MLDAAFAAARGTESRTKKPTSAAGAAINFEIEILPPCAPRNGRAALEFFLAGGLAGEDCPTT
jgi:hypothetical protein